MSYSSLSLIIEQNINKLERLLLQQQYSKYIYSKTHMFKIEEHLTKI